MSELTASKGMRVLIVEDEPYMSGAIRDGLRLEAIAADERPHQALRAPRARAAAQRA